MEASSTLFPVKHLEKDNRAPNFSVTGISPTCKTANSGLSSGAPGEIARLLMTVIAPGVVVNYMLNRRYPPVRQARRVCLIQMPCSVLLCGLLVHMMQPA